MQRPRQPLTHFMAGKILKKACDLVGLVGVSTHSFRRTALTQMSSAGIPLRHLQEISGHNDLGTLQRYLEVSPDQRKKLFPYNLYSIAEIDSAIQRFAQQSTAWATAQSHRSEAFASVTRTPINNPWESTTIWRLRPLTFLPPSNP